MSEETNVSQSKLKLRDKSTQIDKLTRMFMLTRKQDAKTAKTIVHLDCFLVGLAKTFFLADENKSIATSARDRNGSAEETTSKLRASSDFGSRTFTGTFSSTIIG